MQLRVPENIFFASHEMDDSASSALDPREQQILDLLHENPSVRIIIMCTIYLASQSHAVHLGIIHERLERIGERY